MFYVETTRILFAIYSIIQVIPPRSCDCFILKDILQNWSDEDAALILSNLYGVVNKGNRVLVIETILHTGSFSEERVSGSTLSFHLLIIYT